jgi:hypothetical protein
MVPLFPAETNVSASHAEPVMNTTLWATGKTSENGVRYFGRQLVMLRMVGPNGMSIIVDWEAINTEDGSLKEDCEQNATKRLLARFKQNFKRLQVTLIADGLFANQTFITLAEEYGFKYIFTIKDDSLKNIWKEVEKIRQLEGDASTNPLIYPDYGKAHVQITIPKKGGESDTFFRDYEWINDLQHKSYQLSWCSLEEYINEKEKFYFSIITNIPANKDNIFLLMHTARERSLIEDGFNTMKNRGMALEHKYSRKSDTASMNYITLMSIAEILINLVFLSDFVQMTYFRSSKQTIISIVDDLISILKSNLNDNNLDEFEKHIPQKTTYTMPLII